MMGYYTYYTLDARNIKDEDEFDSIIDNLKKAELYVTDDNWGIFDSARYDDVNHTAHITASDDAKWYEHTYDMTKFSRLFPSVTFRLTGEGEERDDLWHEFFRNGECEECRARLLFEEPVWIRWE